MIVDTSVIVAIILREDEADGLVTRIRSVGRARFSVAGYVKAALVLTGRGRQDDLDATLDHLGVTLEPLSVEQAKLARDAGHRFGKGRHCAGLNFGERFAYALAKATGEPLLFKGDDFVHTDLASAGA